MMTPQEQDGKAKHLMTYQKSFPGVEKWEVVAWIMDAYWSVHRRQVKTTGKVIWQLNSRGTCM